VPCSRAGGGGFGVVVDRLIRGCVQQAAELQNLPFDEITRIVAPDDTQRAALEALRAPATAGAQRAAPAADVSRNSELAAKAQRKHVG
jgi:antitoxin component of RelBE/YafQ-DinJ toxin-antitoxin module